MQHYFGTIVNGKAILSGDQIHHLVDVRRGNEGELIEVSEEGESFLCQIASIDPLEINVIKKIEEKRELDIDLAIAFSLLKGDKNEFIIQKCTELGVSSFIPFVSKRTIVDVKDGGEKRITRLSRIGEEAAKQCRRDQVPSVHDIVAFKDLLGMQFDHKLFAYEGEAGQDHTLFSYVGKIEKRSSVLVVIGPEGGFDDEEVALASDYGFAFVGLGRRILRAETAAIYASTIIGASSEE